MGRRTLQAGFLVLAALALANLARSRGGGIPTPAEFLGLEVGQDGVLASYDEIASYWKAVDARSDRVTVLDLGETTMGRRYLMAVITSPENQRRLEEFRRINGRLYDPRLTSEEEARSLIARGRTIVAVQMGIHSDEVGAPQLSLELAHRFATDDTPWMRQVLDETIILLSPSHNPDGTQLVAEWHRRTIGTPYYGGPLPFLYHPYAGHDNNRDWYMFTQKESRMTVGQIWNAWHPQISHDLHQMEPDGARIFVPPYVEPVNPNIDPLLRAQTSALGSHVAAELRARGKTGVLTDAIYDLWTPARAYVDYHGGVRMLSEVASARLAAPVTLTRSALRRGVGYDAARVSSNFPAPWPGGPWRLRDIMEYHRAALDALLDHAARNRRDWLTGFWNVNKNAVGLTAGATAPKPFAVVVPTDQRDPAAAYEMLRVLQIGDVEVHRARSSFLAGGVRYPAGTHAILMAQPAGAFARTLTLAQPYPELHEYPGGPPRRPYDATAHTLPLLMGVRVALVADPFEADLEPVPLPIVPGRGRAPERAAPAYAFAHDSAGIRATIRLARAGMRLAWARRAVRVEAGTLPAGTIVVPDQAGARELLADVANDLPVTVHALPDAGSDHLAVGLPRIGLYKSHLAAVDEGWTRWIFDEWGMPFTTVENAALRNGTPLASRFDAIVLPEQSPAAIVNGIAAGQAPPEYVGGIGEQGVAALRAFVADGGTLVALGVASKLPVERFGLPGVPLVASAGADDPYGPGSILRTRVDVDHPIAYGSPREGVAWFENSPAFRVSGAARAVVRYPVEGSPLLSGLLIGGDSLKGAAAVVDVPLGRGRVVLFGVRPQYRAQTWATFGLFFNALFYSTTTPPGPSSLLPDRP